MVRYRGIPLCIGLTKSGFSWAQDPETANENARTREQAVSVMNLALVCQTHKLGKFRLDLAGESRIWPVYIDKSTPATTPSTSTSTWISTR